MKIKLALISMACMALPAGATLFTSSPDAVIPDNNPNGYVSTISVGGVGSTLTSISVNLNVSGGYNGDLYAYLTYDGQTVTLINRVGTPGNTYGYSDTGFNITLSDGGAAGLHTYQSSLANPYPGSLNGNGQLTGTWQPDSGGVTFASAFNGVNPNGNWELFFADLSAGGQSTLVSWSLDITAVPEPVGLALGIFTGLLGLWWWLERYWTRKVVKGRGDVLPANQDESSQKP